MALTPIGPDDMPGRVVERTAVSFSESVAIIVFRDGTFCVVEADQRYDEPIDLSFASAAAGRQLLETYESVTLGLQTAEEWEAQRQPMEDKLRAQQELRERAELARLKAKYEGKEERGK